MIWEEAAYHTLVRIWRRQQLGHIELSVDEAKAVDELLKAYELGSELEPSSEFFFPYTPTNSPQAGTDGARSSSQSSPLSQGGLSSEVRGSADTKPEDGPITEELLRMRGLLVQCWNERRPPLYAEVRAFFGPELCGLPRDLP